MWLHHVRPLRIKSIIYDAKNHFSSAKENIWIVIITAKAVVLPLISAKGYIKIQRKKLNIQSLLTLPPQPAWPQERHVPLSQFLW